MQGQMIEKWKGEPAVWKYQDILEQIFSAYDPGDDIYAPIITITSDVLCASQGPEFCEMTFENGEYRLKHRVEDRRSYTVEQEYKSEEQALFHWLVSFSYTLSNDNDTKKRIKDLEKDLYAKMLAENAD